MVHVYGIGRSGGVEHQVDVVVLIVFVRLEGGINGMAEQHMLNTNARKKILCCYRYLINTDGRITWPNPKAEFQGSIM